MKKLCASLLCLLLLAAFALAEDASAPDTLVTARYEFWETRRFASDSVTLRVDSNGTSTVSLRFHYVVSQRAAVPEEPIIRLVKMDGVEGLYGQADLIPPEPPYAEARHKRRFLLAERIKGCSHYNVTLRRYADFDVLSVFFCYKDLPEGALELLNCVTPTPSESPAAEPTPD